MPVTPSPLRYPGGKTALTSMIGCILQANKTKSCHYAEPYAGGAGLALSLMFKGYVQEIHLNDLDTSIWSFWHSVLEHTDELIDKILQTPVTLEEWHRQRHIQENKELYNSVDLGFSTFFLNRTNRSGIILKAGIIGGLKQKGSYSLDCRFNKNSLIKKLRHVAKYKHRIHLYNLDAIDLMRQLDSTLPAGAIFYIDPPYFAKGAQLYTNFYDEEDHVKVYQTVCSLKHKWIVTYDNVQKIIELYKFCKMHVFTLNYSVAIKRKGTELLVTHKDLIIPSNLVLSGVLSETNKTCI